MANPDEIVANVDVPAASAPVDGVATPPPATPGLKKAALNSAAWTMAGFGTLLVLRFVSNIILTHLLFPEIFGLMALVGTFIQGLHMFTDIGIGPSIVRSKHGDDPNFLNTAWTLQIVRAVGLWLASGLIAWPVAAFYGESQLMRLIPAVGLATAISGLNSTSMLTLSRHLAQARLVVLEVATYIFSQAIVIVWVCYQRTVWALVVGNLIGSVAVMAGSHLFLPGIRNRLHWDRTAVREVLHFGRWIFLGTMLTFVGDQADRLVLGKLDLVLLGVYSIGVTLAQVPTGLLERLNWQLVFPLYSRAYHQRVPVRAAFAKVHVATTGLAAFMVTGLIATGPAFIRCVYDDRYWAAAWMVQLLAVGAWFRMLEATGDSFLLSLGKSGVSAISNGAKVIVIPILVPLGYWLGGIFGGETGKVPGLIVGFVGGDLVRYAVTAWLIRREGMPILRYDVLMSLAIGLTSALVWQINSLAWAEGHKWLRFGVEVLAVVLLWAVLAAVGWFQGTLRLSWAGQGER
jgi:O-antigen/teichoic acid export membrane protein